MSDDRLPFTFGRYVLRERVGQGGMAEVFRASLPGFGGFDKQVAIKRMFRQYSHDPKFIEMLTDEAKIVSQLAHPNIVQILDVGQIQNDYFIGFEYVEGVDLFRLLQRHHELGRDLPLGMACFVVAELCSALDYAHSRRTTDGTALHIVHRDVSPQNVLLSLIGEVKLTDFGIAKAAYRYTHTQAGMVKGKIYYMSPEQALGHSIDHRSDLFSAGILLFETLCTRPLYDEIDQKVLLDKVCAAAYDWPADKLRRVPPSLVAVVQKALQPQAGNRYQTGRGFRDAILAVTRELAIPCDREEFGQYLRSMYHVEADRPPSVVVQRPRVTAMGQEQERWHSVMAPVPFDDDEPTQLPLKRPPPGHPAAQVSQANHAAGLGGRSNSSVAHTVMGTEPPQSQPPARPSGPRVPLPGSVQGGTATPAPQEPRLQPAPPPRPPGMPAALRPAEPVRSADLPPALPPMLLPVRPPPRPAQPTQVAQPPQPPPGSGAGPAAGMPPLPASVQAGPQPMSRPAQRPPGTPMPAAPRPVPVQRATVEVGPPPVPVERRPSATAVPGYLAPTNPTRTPGVVRPSTPDPRRTTAAQPAARPQVAEPARQDESTAMLDQAEMDHRLAEARAAAAQPEPPRQSEASTRFVDAMPEEIEDTTKPGKGKKPKAAAVAAVPVAELAPGTQGAADPDEAPASWQLLALTALVWTGVLVLGVYATLLTVTR